MLRNAGRGVQRDGCLDHVEIRPGNAVAAQEVPRRIRPINLEPLMRAAVLRSQPHVVEHRASLEQF